MNGKSSMFSMPPPFALSLSKGERRVFQHPARVKESTAEDDQRFAPSAMRFALYGRLSVVSSHSQGVGGRVYALCAKRHAPCAEG